MMLGSEQLPSTSATLWRTHGEQLIRYATVLVGPSDADDVAIDAFLATVDRLAGGSIEYPSSYLYRAVSNRAHDLRRSRERRWRRDLAAVRPVVTDGFVSNPDVLRAVARLSLAQRSVIYFAYWEDRTEREISAILGIAPGTVRRHLVRARTHLRKALQ